MTERCLYQGCVNPQKTVKQKLCYSHQRQLRLGKEMAPLRTRRATTVRNDAGLKECSRCSTWKDLGHFTNKSRSKDGLNMECRECSRDQKLLRKYGITSRDYAGLISAQAHLCDSCSSSITAAGFVDHNHRCCPSEVSCGQCIRGILCLGCNTALGAFADSLPNLLESKNYLRQGVVDWGALGFSEGAQSIVPRAREKYRPAISRNLEGNKQCTRCREWKMEVKFSASPSTGDLLNSHCTQCKRDSHLERRYKITAAMYSALSAEFSQACGICKRHESTLPRGLNIDHDHSCCPSKTSCGKCIRGLLCVNCNVGLGLAKDSPDRLSELISYLQKYSSPRHANMETYI